MEGKDDPPDLRGIIPNTFNYVFDTISQHSKCWLCYWWPQAHVAQHAVVKSAHSTCQRTVLA